jgi:hypothetical protein
MDICAESDVDVTGTDVALGAADDPPVFWNEPYERVAAACADTLGSSAPFSAPYLAAIARYCARSEAKAGDCATAISIA